MENSLNNNLIESGLQLQEELSLLNEKILSVEDLGTLIVMQESIHKTYMSAIEKQKNKFITALSPSSLLNKSFYSSMPLRGISSVEIGLVDETLASLLLKADSIELYSWFDFMDDPVAHYDEVELVRESPHQNNFDKIFANKSNSSNLYLVFIFAGEDYRNGIINNLSHDVYEQFFVKI